jgi:hypothetical protein
MNFKNFVVASGLALASVGASAAADLAWIEGLYNTGEVFFAGEQDTNYAFTVINGTATGTGGYGIVSEGVGFPFNAWSANSAASSWLTPSANAGQSYDPSSDGLYKWSISFDLSGKNLSSASFSGRWWADNQGYVQLNGVTISTGVNLSSPTSFAASSGFVAGMNTLDFFVTNFAQGSGNPTGVRVEFLDSYAVAAVPEPESWALILAGLAVVGAIARRRIG